MLLFPINRQRDFYGRVTVSLHHFFHKEAVIWQMELYNAMSGKHYTDPELLEINTLENAIYMSIKNDLSFLIDGRLSLYEHQSTCSPNLPLRFLFYISHLYSKMTREENLYYDEHYLCTVAAGGHRRVVKPIRMGVRHGHPVIVNRQLCIANAFEQILEERMPKIHRRIRHFYDTYGFPVARLIHSPYIADLVYILMKPLEWLFLAVIYAVDTKPENRIAVQYLAKSEKSGYNK